MSGSDIRLRIFCCPAGEAVPTGFCKNRTSAETSQVPGDDGEEEVRGSTRPVRLDGRLLADSGDARHSHPARLSAPNPLSAREHGNLILTRAISPGKLRILGMGRKPQKNDSLPGSLDMLILRTLSRRDLHGYGIVQFIQQSSDNELLVEEGSLYPALQRLELNGWIDGAWGVTSNNRRARIYTITTAGRQQLAVETQQYAKLTLAIARVMGAE